jgi:hypothetical protein
LSIVGIIALENGDFDDDDEEEEGEDDDCGMVFFICLKVEDLGDEV